jgi:oxygen-independent coproporphyrinogen-3 oxidase
MAGIYLHIPFCRKACHYCNFHFSTTLNHKNDMMASLLWELKEKRKEIGNGSIQTIYFGGGTPSLLSAEEIQALMQQIKTHYHTAILGEVTLEANPDDITEEKLIAWKQAGINRLSIGIQSFREEDLIRMNRSHSAMQALQCIPMAQSLGFENITLDLIFGYPELDHATWKNNIDTALALQVPHISCYAMTVEPKTALAHQIKKGILKPLDSDHAAAQYEYLMQRLEDAGFEHYEISSYAKPGFRAVHNSNYWNQVHYLGIGPSAHSYHGVSRSWNVANNALYIKQCEHQNLQPEVEILSRSQQINEWIMVRLRVKEGIELDWMEHELTSIEKNKFDHVKDLYLKEGMLIVDKSHLKLTRKGKLFADAIALDFFV